MDQWPLVIVDVLKRELHINKLCIADKIYKCAQHWIGIHSVYNRVKLLIFVSIPEATVFTVSKVINEEVIVSGCNNLKSEYKGELPCKQEAWWSEDTQRM